jgi:hypothetical protein
VSLIRLITPLADALYLRLTVSGTPAVKIRGAGCGCPDLGGIPLNIPVIVESSWVSLDGREVWLLARCKGDLFMLAGLHETGSGVMGVHLIDRAKLPEIKSMSELLERRQPANREQIEALLRPGIVASFTRVGLHGSWLPMAAKAA